ncbi:MAG: enoyl-CoA hydratase [Beijerinckiaceae bacterium]|jgi:enoyl-CoA hydratase/carnithine racemase|nr:enoyl-CoA hydratase [Beijerinckiaceae bacterium]
MNTTALVEAPAPLIHIEDRGAIRIITLANPQRRNPLSTAMIAALHAALQAAAGECTVRVVLLAHEGPAFSAGHDLREIQAARAAPDQGRAFFVSLMAACSALMLQIRAMPQPVIAVVEGVATAAGCQLVATCDLALAGTEARFATPGVNIGLFCSTPMVALSRNVSPKHAMEMLLTGDLVDAATAARFGLVNRVVPCGTAMVEAEALAQRIAGKPAAVLKIGKEAFYRQNEMSLEAAYIYASEVMVENMLMREAQEGIGAFVAPKR